MHQDIEAYNSKLSSDEQEICAMLATIINESFKDVEHVENKIWHRHPVWFINGNPIVGYSKLKNCIRLLFWSGQSFDEKRLSVEGSFKAAEIRYDSVEQINKTELKRWLKKSKVIQWDYKNIVTRKGKLERLF